MVESHATATRLESVVALEVGTEELGTENKNGLVIEFEIAPKGAIEAAARKNADRGKKMTTLDVRVAPDHSLPGLLAATKEAQRGNAPKTRGSKAL